MNNLLKFIEKQPRWLIVATCIVITVLTGLFDYISRDFSLAIFYIAPITLAVWLLGRVPGFMVALLCGVELFSIDRFFAPKQIHLFSFRSWNALMEVFFLLFVCHVLALLKNELIQKRKRTEELEFANLELDAFNHTVAHDLRKPLTVINGYSQAISEMYGAGVDRKCLDYLNEIYKATLRMNGLIDALLNFSRVAHSELHMEAVDLSAMADIIAAEQRMTDPERKVEVRIDKGISAYGDPKLLRLVLENLFGNAWKYTAKNADAVISFGMTYTERSPVYFVRDNGIGFDCSQAEKLFIPFQRLHGADEFAGFGIGMATVRRIIQRHGGRIWAEGKPERGATFYFTLGAAMKSDSLYSVRDRRNKPESRQ